MKNRKKANIILSALILIFLILAVLKHYYGEPLAIRMLIFIVEAALVGSIADWFAITALFEKPLGLPIKPIIPSNREKILSSLSVVVNNNLLDMNYIQNTVKNIPVSESLIHFIDNTDAIFKARDLLYNYLLDELSSLKNDKARIKRFVNYLKEKVNDIDSTKTKVIYVADKYIDKNFTKGTYSALIHKAIVYLNKDTTFNNINKELNALTHDTTGKKTKLFDFSKIIVGDSEKLIYAILFESISFLKELNSSEEKYIEVKNTISRFSEDYLNKTDLSKLIIDFIDNFRIEERICLVLARMEKIIASVANDNDSSTNHSTAYDADLQSIADIITDIVQDLWKEIKKDEDTLTWIDSSIKGLILEIIAKNRTEFSKFVEERIKGFSDEQLSSLILNSAGEPLHWIRINGAILGGMLGVILFSFINFLYEPYILPLAYKLISIL